MYDLQRIGKTISDIEKYLKEVESYKIKKYSDLSDSKTYNASSMLVFAILNRTIDLGSDILLAENLGAPNFYQDIMPLLAKGGVINKEQAEKINLLIKQRNILAHFYEDISEKELFNSIKSLDEIENLIKTVKKRLKIVF